MRDAMARIPDMRSSWVLAAIAAGLVVATGTVRFGVLGAAASLVIIAGFAAAVAGFLDVRFALSLSLVALPLDAYGRLINEPLALTVYQVVLLVALAAWAFALVRGQQEVPKPSAVDAAMALLVFAGIWSLPHSLAPSATMFAIVRLVFIWAYVAVISHNLRTSVELRTFVNVLVATGVAGGLLAITQYLGVDVGNIHVQGPQDLTALSRVSGFFDDPNYFAGFLTACAVASSALLAHAKRPRDAVLYAIAAGVSGLGVVLTLSRTAWLGLAVGLIAVALTAPKRVRFVLVTLGVLGILAVVALQPQAFVDRFNSSFDVSGDRSVATRVYMADSMMEMIADNPIWGTGLAAFDQEYPYYRQPFSSRTIVRPHQIPLGLWAETGIAGLLAQIVLLLAVAFVLLVDRQGRPLSPYESVALAGFACMSIQALFQYYLYFEYLWIFVALAAAASRVARGEKEALDRV